MRNADQNQGYYREEQIVGTREKPQWIVIQRLLSHSQHPDATKSSAKDLSHAHVMLRLAGVIFVDWYLPVKSGEPRTLHVNAHTMKSIA